jgi:hypothetical protein
MRTVILITSLCLVGCTSVSGVLLNLGIQQTAGSAAYLINRPKDVNPPPVYVPGPSQTPADAKSSASWTGVCDPKCPTP